MTAIEFKKYILECNLGDSPASVCPAVFRGLTGEARAQLRKRAGVTGWTHVKSEFGPFYDYDYCPHHKPEAK